jgi:two-component system, chemotaxis family, response regulator Rcp1
MQEVMKKKKRVNILMVEDNYLDALLTTEILSETDRADYQVSTVKDGMEALAYLHGLDKYENAPRPDLIILDLNLPRMNGFDFLARIKKETGLKTIPVCILTTSEAREDIEKAKELNTDCYLIKPLDLKIFEEAFSGIGTGSPD